MRFVLHCERLKPHDHVFTRGFRHRKAEMWVCPNDTWVTFLGNEPVRPATGIPGVERGERLTRARRQARSAYNATAATFKKLEAAFRKNAAEDAVTAPRQRLRDRHQISHRN